MNLVLEPLMMSLTFYHLFLKKVHTLNEAQMEVLWLSSA